MSDSVGWFDVDDPEQRKAGCPRLTAVQLEVLYQLRMTVWDGYLISKTARSELVDMGLATRCNGWQVLTREGLAVLDTYGLLKDDRYGTRGTGAGDSLWTVKPKDFARLREEGMLR